MATLWLFLLLGLMAKGYPSCNASSSAETSLRRTLFWDYDSNAPPYPLNSSERLKIYFDFILEDLINVNVKNYKMTASFIIFATWYDHRLRWAPEKYSNLTNIVHSRTNIWTPKLSLFPSYIEVVRSNDQGSVEIEYSGKITWTFQRTLSHDCRVSQKYNTSDLQECNYKFDLLGKNNIIEIHFTNSSAPLAARGTGKWRLLFMKRKTEVRDRNQLLTLTIVLRREPAQSKRKIINPIMYLSIVPVITFVIPVASGERISFVAIGFLSLIMALQYTLSELPQNNVSYVTEMSKRVLNTTAASVILACLLSRLHSLEVKFPAFLTKWLGKSSKESSKGRSLSENLYSEGDSMTRKKEDCEDQNKTEKRQENSGWSKFLSCVEVVAIICFFAVWVTQVYDASQKL